ncbi:hypothetical protein B0O80DRAFT_455287 [Mortierella sp. GBAus27b]|nr:hypothetical protein B0O80DRAFT_455287 [Mortierella sp. GBAus27b]
MELVLHLLHRCRTLMVCLQISLSRSLSLVFLEWARRSRLSSFQQHHQLDPMGQLECIRHFELGKDQIACYPLHLLCDQGSDLLPLQSYDVQDTSLGGTLEL